MPDESEDTQQDEIDEVLDGIKNMEEPQEEKTDEQKEKDDYLDHIKTEDEKKSTEFYDKLDEEIIELEW